MNTQTITKHIPDATIAVVHQNGNTLTTPTKGFDIHLHFHAGEATPRCAEIDGGSAYDDGHYAEIGLTFDGLTLADYDGVFEIPAALAAWLLELGYTIPDDCE